MSPPHYSKRQRDAFDKFVQRSACKTAVESPRSHPTSTGTARTGPRSSTCLDNSTELAERNTDFAERSRIPRLSCQSAVEVASPRVGSAMSERMRAEYARYVERSRSQIKGDIKGIGKIEGREMGKREKKNEARLVEEKKSEIDARLMEIKRNYVDSLLEEGKMDMEAEFKEERKIEKKEKFLEEREKENEYRLLDEREDEIGAMLIEEKQREIVSMLEKRKVDIKTRLKEERKEKIEDWFEETTKKNGSRSKEGTDESGDSCVVIRANVTSAGSRLGRSGRSGDEVQVSRKTSGDVGSTRSVGGRRPSLTSGREGPKQTEHSQNQSEVAEGWDSSTQTTMHERRRSPAKLKKMNVIRGGDCVDDTSTTPFEPRLGRLEGSVSKDRRLPDAEDAVATFLGARARDDIRDLLLRFSQWAVPGDHDSLTAFWTKPVQKAVEMGVQSAVEVADVACQVDLESRCFNGVAHGPVNVDQPEAVKSVKEAEVPPKSSQTLSWAEIYSYCFEDVSKDGRQEACAVASGQDAPESDPVAVDSTTSVDSVKDILVLLAPTSLPDTDDATDDLTDDFICKPCDITEYTRDAVPAAAILAPTCDWSDSASARTANDERRVHRCDQSASEIDKTCWRCGLPRFGLRLDAPTHAQLCVAAQAPEDGVDAVLSGVLLCAAHYLLAQVF